MTSKLIRPGELVFLVLFLLFGSACSGDEFKLGLKSQETTSAPDRLKLLVGEEGLYRITAGELSRSGFNLGKSLDYDHVQLSTGAAPVPFLIKDDALIFYGQPSNDRYYAKRPYMLEIGQPGLAMSQSRTAPAGDQPLQHVRKTLLLEEDLLYIPESRQENSDVWFWSKLSQQDTFTTSFSQPSVADGPALLRLHVWGFSQNPDLENDHDFEILVNDIPIGSAVFDGQRHYTAEVALPASIIKPGDNTITLDNQKNGGALLDIIYVNWLELEFPVPPIAVNDRLDVTTEAGKLVINGFSGSPVVLDTSDPAQPAWLAGWQDEKGPFELATTEGQHITAAGPRGFLNPEIEAVQESNWLDEGHQADLIIITTTDLAPVLAPLVAAREAQGLNVAIVPVDEIYNEAGNGASSPESIQEFVAYAYQHWQSPRPRYLLLVGDATSDYWGRLGDPPENVVPSLMVPVQISGETVSDSRLVDVDHDQRPDLAVGRWPVRTQQETADLVKRTLAYEARPAGNHAFFATDGSDRSFKQIASQIIDQTPLKREQVIQSENPTAEEIGELWQTAPWLAAYLGHGSLDRWGKDNIFSLQELDKLTGDSAPIVLQLTCLTGLFSNPEQRSLAEGMLLHNRGPVLVIAASSLTFSYHQEPFAIEFLNQLQDRNIVRIGDAFLNAKESLDIENSEGYREISDTFALFGDPSAKISRP